MQTLPSLETIKSWPELVPGLHWSAQDGTSKTDTIVAAKSQVKVHYKAYLVQADQSLQQIDASFDGEFSSITDSTAPFSFVLASKSILDSWEHIFAPSESHKGIHVGQMVEFFAPAHLCYGASGSPPKVPANADLFFQLLVVSTASNTRSPLEIADKSQKLKDLGNKLFQAGAHQPAADSYTRALDNLRFLFPEEESDQEVINGIRLVCNLNRAACQLKLNLFAEAKQSCSDALYIDPTNVKAFYRRAQAHCSTFDFDRAKRDIVAAIKQSPQDTTLRAELKNIQERQAEYEKRSQEALAQFAKGAFTDK